MARTHANIRKHIDMRKQVAKSLLTGHDVTMNTAGLYNISNKRRRLHRKGRVYLVDQQGTHKLHTSRRNLRQTARMGYGPYAPKARNARGRATSHGGNRKGNPRHDSRGRFT